jgi:hypothetical protein
VIYNKELKMRYIQEKNELSTLPSNYLECQFNKVGKFENELNKDVHDFTVYEIIEYYKILNATSLEVLAVLNSHLSLYCQWCLQQSLVIDNQNHFLELTLDQLKSCLNKVLIEKKIISREQIIEYCESIPNPKDQVVLLGLFEGMKGKDFCDFVNLRPEDVSGNKLKLIDGREIVVSDKLIKYIEESISEDKYYSISGNQTKTMPLVDRGYVLKNYPNVQEGTSAFAKGRIIYNGVARSLKYIGVLEFMSANSIFESGKIWMIKKRAAELGISTKDYVYSDYIREVEYQFGCKIVRSVFWLKYEDHLI